MQSVSRAKTSIHALSICIVLVYLLPVSDNTITISHAYLRQMVVELYTLCPHSSSCKPIADWHNPYTYLIIDSPQINYFNNDKACCTWCYCDDGCLDDRRCCPDIMLSNYSDGETVEDIQYECRMSHFKVPSDNMRGYVMTGTFMTDACLLSLNVTDKNSQVKCEMPDINDIDEMIPVESLTSGRVYINEYCAACSGDGTNVKLWHPYIGLVNWKAPIGLMNAYKDKSWQELYRLSYEPDTDLNMFFISDNQANYDWNCIAPVIYDCNVTGLWSKYDPYYEFACAVYRSNYFHSNDGIHISAIFGNVFCGLCNGVFHNVSICNLPAAHDITSPGYMSLINYKETDPDTDSTSTGGGGWQKVTGDTCPDSDFFDPLNNVCRPWKCAKRYYYNGERCISTLSGFLGSNLLFMVTAGPFAANFNISRVEMLHLADEVTSLIFLKGNETLDAVSIKLFKLSSYSTPNHNNTYLVLLLMYISVFDTTAAQSDMYMNTFLTSMEKEPTLDFLINGTVIKLSINLAENIALHTLDYYSVQLVNIDDGTVMDELVPSYVYLVDGTRRLARVSKLEICALFLLPEEEYTDYDRYITLRLANVTFYNTQYEIVDGENGVTMCVDVYLAAVSQYVIAGAAFLALDVIIKTFMLMTSWMMLMA